ncbi:hypothetical protein COLO4_23944 [Corchorus olitorius]|uniref:Uncharacterized protein n=1 Tax=Corchorus olitorius TaxID=93759 RepID=A0A1R3IDY5_9ROSI|nr:hypothetical protein COLO4_23944 [Corchorus olitorius]
MFSLMSHTSIESVDLSNNQFQIPSSLQPFFNHSKLKYFNGDNNNIFVDTELHSFAPLFQLSFISLSCCGNVGRLPKFLHHQHELQYVNLPNINLTDEFPSWLLENNTQLETLFLLNNSLSGHLKLPFHQSMKLLELDISNNFLDGHIPTEIGRYLPGLKFLNISRNSLVGGIPSSIGGMKLLEKLDLSNNRLSGIIPESLGVNCSFIIALILSNNSLQGQLFSSNFNLINLEQLQLASNNFTGVIPNGLANCSLLSTIDFGDNHFSGRIPQWLGNLSSLKEIIMLNNDIEGLIPMEFCELDKLEVLDLSMNNISGTLPPCFRPLRVNHVHLSRNSLRGSIPNSLCNSSFLVTLDFSYNQLSGNIPNCIGELLDLSYLVLGHNNLQGQIPNQFCQLNKLSLIDLSHNNLVGVIPLCLNVTVYDQVVRNSTLEPYNNKTQFGVTVPTDHGSIKLTTKSITYTYKGRILRFLSGIDLSANKLTGEIPHQMGNLDKIVLLNLSYNTLTGPIPSSFSNLSQIESLDLSYNNLSGGIPPRFVLLHFLAYFNVSYNNLSGKPPPRSAQFASDFDENGYWGNPLLCGEPLPKNCSKAIEPSSSNSTKEHRDDQEDGGFMDIESFFQTFGVSYIMVLLGIAAVLYINPYWRQAWLYFVERVITTCFYFFIDNLLPRQFRFYCI